MIDRRQSAKPVTVFPNEIPAPNCSNSNSMSRSSVVPTEGGFPDV